MTDKTYNGWSNYETWVVKLWMDNDEISYNFWRERVQDHIATYTDREDGWKDEAVNCLADEIKDTHEADLPHVEGFAADLLNAAMGEVDWREMAESMIDDYISDHHECLQIDEEQAEA
jgi:hypothetical protein